MDNKEKTIQELVAKYWNSPEVLSIEKVGDEWAVLVGEEIVFTHKQYSYCDAVLGELDNAMADMYLYWDLIPPDNTEDNNA
jgi:hypothetical protein